MAATGGMALRRAWRWTIPHMWWHCISRAVGVRPPFPRPDARVNAPTGCGSFPLQYDRRDNPLDTTSAEARKAAEARYNVVHFTTMPHGGHFPAFEQPRLWLEDFRVFFASVRKNER